MDVFIAFCLGTVFGAMLVIFTLALIAGITEDF